MGSGYVDVMPGLFDKVSKFARSPQGQRLAERAKTFAAKPENRRKVEQLRERLARRGGGSQQR